MNRPAQRPAGEWEWPRWNWRDSGWWFTAFGAAFSALTFVYPSLARRPLRVRLFIAGVAFLASCALFLVSAHLLRVLRVAWGRLQDYQRLLDLSERRQEAFHLVEEQRDREASQFQEAVHGLLAMTGAKRFEIDST